MYMDLAPTIGSGTIGRRDADMFTVALKACVYAATAFGALFVFALTDGTTSLSVVVGVCLAIGAALVVQRANRARPHAKMVTLFFWLAAGHALCGYWGAGHSTEVIWIGSNAEQMFRRSFFVIAATLAVASFAYDVASHFPSKRAQRIGAGLQVSEQLLTKVARVFLVLGLALVTYVFVGAGFMPILASDPGAARHLSEDLVPGYSQYEFALYKGLDLLACAAPLVLFSGLIRKRKLDWILGIMGVLAVFITLRRGHLVSLCFVSLLTIAFVKEKLPRRYFAYMAFLGITYVLSQLFLIRSDVAGANQPTSVSVSLSALPEVRDLGWVMSLAGDKRLYGATFIQPLIPVPSFANEFKKQHSLSATTTSLIGSSEQEMAGLRITVAGEGFLNFGIWGCLIVGAVFGALSAWISQLSDVLQEKRDLASSYLSASLLIWFCFWLYLGGTSNAGTIKYGFLIAIVMFYLARVRSHRQIRRIPAT